MTKKPKLTSPFQELIKQDTCATHAGNRFTRLAKGLHRKRGDRNRTEAAYETNVLAPTKLAGEILDWWFEPLTIRLTHPETGQPATYTPDFMVLANDGTIYMDDTKGSGPDDPASIVRIKCAAELYPLFVWRLAKLTQSGCFEIRIV